MQISKDFKKYANHWFENRYNFLPKQFYCQIHLTQACQYNCVHCYFQEISDNSKSTLSFSQTKNIIDKIKFSASMLNLKPRVDFTGGDPLLHPNFFDIAEYTVSQGIPFGIKGNPDLLEGEFLTQLRKLKIQDIRLSLEGLEPFHDGIRGEGSFNKTAQAIGYLKDKGFIVKVHTTISKFNLKQLIPVLNFFISNNFLIDDWTWARHWSVEEPGDLLTREQLKNVLYELLDFYNHIFSEENFYFCNDKGEVMPRIFIGFKEHLWFPFLLKEGYIEEHIAEKINNYPNNINCTATQHVYIIDNDGVVYKCRKIRTSSIGNILDESFEEMLRKEVAQRYVNLREYSVCGNCHYFNGCGGCAAIAEAKRGSVLRGDPDCFIEGCPSSTIKEFETQKLHAVAYQ